MHQRGRVTQIETSPGAYVRMLRFELASYCYTNVVFSDRRDAEGHRFGMGAVMELRNACRASKMAIVQKSRTRWTIRSSQLRHPIIAPYLSKKQRDSPIRVSPLRRAQCGTWSACRGPGIRSPDISLCPVVVRATQCTS
jgi:hypothetical protein